MADQSEETMEEKMARQSQEPEQRLRAVGENIEPLLESRDLVRAESTQMLQGIPVYVIRITLYVLLDILSRDDLGNTNITFR